jgi:hypothetical protein
MPAWFALFFLLLSQQAGLAHAFAHQSVDHLSQPGTQDRPVSVQDFCAKCASFAKVSALAATQCSTTAASASTAFITDEALIERAVPIRIHYRGRAPPVRL